MTIEAARAVADAVLYEGYLLYPYRASSAKNRSRWQFGVLGPPFASASAFGEPPGMAMQCLLTPGGHVTVHLRFLHLQVRVVERPAGPGLVEAVPAVTVDGETILSWDEAVEHEVTLPPFTGPPLDFPVTVPGFASVEPLPAGAGRIVRRRWPLTARVLVNAAPDGDLLRLTVTVTNEHPDPVADKESTARHSLLGTHLLLEATGASFVSLVDPPPPFAAAAARCHQDRCWPVLAGTNALLLGAPIILYDHPQIAAESPGPLFDLTEIDEILTLRVMTMTDDEKAEARATDPRARAIIDRCDALTPTDLQKLHGARRPAPTPPPSSPAPHHDTVAPYPTQLSAPPRPLAPSPDRAPGSKVLVALGGGEVPASSRDRVSGGEVLAPLAADDALAPSRDRVPDGEVLASLAADDALALSRDRVPGGEVLASFGGGEVPASSRDRVSGGDVLASFGGGEAFASSRDHAPVDDVPVFGEAPWWDPAADASVDPARDTVDVGGVLVGRDSLVRLRPTRRADAQDLFLAGRLARVTAVLSDVDGGTHVAVVLTDDPAADLHDWYGRYYYFAPDELEPAGAAIGGENRS